ncbi:MAG: hypothetical protein ABJB47_00950 [Actinomycetota bacterium]
MSEFDKLKDDAEQYAQQHPDQVKEGEQAVGKRLGLGGQDDAQQGRSQPGDSQGTEDQQADSTAAAGGAGSGQNSGGEEQ